MVLSECINFMLTSAQNAVHLYFKKELQEFNVTPIQYALLKCLWDEDQLTPTQLAQTLSLDTSTIAGLLSRLESKELIFRTFCKTDRRRIIVCLTDAGRILQEPIERRIAEINQRITAQLTPEELGSFKAQLQLIADTASTLANG